MNDFYILIQDGLIIFLGILVQAIPFVLIGVMVSSFLGEFLRQDTLIKFFPKSRLGSLLFACLFGFLFPVCECGNIPVARKLVQRGLSPAVALTFLFSAPAFNPIVIFATFAAFPNNPEIAWLRITFTFFIAFLIGLVFSYHPKPETMFLDSLASTQISASAVPAHGKNSRLRNFFRATVHEFFEMAVLLLPGALIAAFTQIVLPRDVLLGLGKGPVFSILALMALAFILSVCSHIDAFLALSYFNVFTTGSIVAFLTFGPMVDIKSLFMFRGIFTKKIIFFSCFLAFILTLFGSLLLNIFFF